LWYPCIVADLIWKLPLAKVGGVFFYNMIIVTGVIRFMI
jgi:hypothetical protein